MKQQIPMTMAAGIFYTATAVVALASSAFPMFNASLFIILLGSLRRFAAPGASDA